VLVIALRLNLSWWEVTRVVPVGAVESGIKELSIVRIAYYCAPDSADIWNWKFVVSPLYPSLLVTMVVKVDRIVFVHPFAVEYKLR